MQYLELDGFEVLTDNGFKSFSGIKQTTGSIFRTTLNDGSYIDSSIGHLVKMKNGEYTRIDDLKYGDILSSGLSVIETKFLEHGDLFDLTNVDDGNHYTTNNIESHNCAFIENFDDTWKAILPVVSSGRKSKIILTSTPNGMNHWYDLWESSLKGISGFKPYTTSWITVKERLYNGKDKYDDGFEWSTNQIGSSSIEAFKQEHCLTGDTMVTVLIDELEKEMTIEELYRIMYE